MLAIVIPYYKITFFEETLKSLASQSNKNFNVYVGDDASLQDPRGLIEKYEKNINITYKRFKRNLGSKSLVKQWERCINLVNDEEWLMILGDDDFLSNNLVEKFYSNKKEFNKVSHVVRFSSCLDTERGLKNKLKQPKLELPIDSYYRKITEKNRSSLSEYIFRKSAFLKIGFYSYPLGWCSDDRAWIEFSNDKPIYSINSATVFIRISSISITGNDKDIDIKNKTKKEFELWYYENKTKDFSKDKRLKILYYIESFLKNSYEISLKDFLWFFREYLLNFNLLPFVKLCRRFFIFLFYKK